MAIIAVKTKAEFRAALKKKGAIVKLLKGIFDLETKDGEAPEIIVTGKAELSLVAFGSSQPRVEAWGSSQPRVVAWGSSQPRVVAWESSQPRVVAWESSQPRVVAWGYVQLSLLGKVLATCAANVAVLIRGAARVEGGQQTIIKLETAQDWCDFYGVKVEDGVATVYKALNADYTSSHGTSYAPGTVPVAQDWDKGKSECGGGLHFSPTPKMAREFNYDATKFVACQVALKDIRPPTDSDDYPQKIKAKGCCGPCVEVDEDGEPVTAPKQEAA